MNETEILEGTKIIADFMQVKVTEFQWQEFKSFAYCDDEGYVDLMQDLVYYSPNDTWWQLMDAVVKIEGMAPNRVEIVCNTCKIVSDKVFKNTDESKIKATFKSVVSFIKWYNKKFENPELLS